MVDYRPLPDDRMDEFQSFVTYAFSPEDGPHDPDEDDALPEPAQIGDQYGVFDGDDLLAVCAHYWFDARIRGRVHGLPGLSAVATPPENRRRGLVRDMLVASLREYRERDYYLSALWPFKHPFYAQFGWATSNRHVRHEFPPDAVAFARDAAPAGRWDRLEADDWERLAPVLAAHGREYELTLERTEAWWRKRVFDGWGTEPFVYCWRDDTGADRAYVVYRVDDDADGKTLRVSDVAWADHGARLAVLEFLADHDSQVSTVSLSTAPDSDLVDVVPDPGEVETTVSAGPMVRVVDVVDALEAIDYGADREVVLSVTDPLVDRNDDTFRVAVTDGTATVDRTDGAPGASLDVGSLAQLVVGYRSASALARTNDLEADANAIETLAALYPESTVYLREGF